MEHGDFVMAAEWLSEGILNNMEEDDDIKKLRSLGTLSSLYLKMNELTRAKEVNEEMLSLNPESRSAKSALKLITKRLDAGYNKVLNDTKDELEFTEEIVEACIREYHTDRTCQDRLRSYEKFVPLIGDYIKIEELHRNPKVVMIHDIIPETEVEKMRSKTYDEIWRDLDMQVEYMEENALTYTRAEWEFIQWPLDRLRNISYFNQGISDDDILSSIQVHNSASGGSLEPVYHEQTQMWTLKEANLIGRYLLFLNEARSGGDIVFPDLKLRIAPKKGAGIFWQFRRWNGPVHRSFRKFVECPVLAGSQWYAKANVEHYGILHDVVL